MLYRKIEGKPARIKLGRFPELTVENARKMAASLNGQIAEERNPQTEKLAVRAELTFGALFEMYFTQYCLTFNRDPQNNKRVIEPHVLPESGKLKLGAITPERTRRLHHAIAQKFADTQGRSTANKALSLSRAAFKF